ncbi:IclR family transcriptional regulator [Sciscionella marina]|uniref:IclR family transcriptional regulator n=1 Tax=Sciscionella marina TaxID=508770 RepID=UPI00036561BD|nr:IclR family transcriptional regulator [Sciscionella marina]
MDPLGDTKQHQTPPLQETKQVKVSATTASSTAVGKALALLDALGSGRSAEPLAALATRAGLPKSTACRILGMMEDLGFVGRRDSLYCLGDRIAELGRQAGVSGHKNLRNASLGPLERLYGEVRTTVHLAVLSNAEVLYLEKITAPGGSGIPTRVGHTAPATCTALGKAQLAFSDTESIDAVLRRPMAPLTARSARSKNQLVEQLAEVRRTGLAVDHEEFRNGLFCVAAPIVVRGRAIAAVSVSSIGGGSQTSRRAVLVREAARRISGQLDRAAIVAPYPSPAREQQKR